MRAAKPTAALSQQKVGGETILLVEDDARRTAQVHKGTIHLFLTDVIMPSGSGPEVVTYLAARFPDLKVLYMSGYTGTAMAHQGILETGSPLLQNPIRQMRCSASMRGARRAALDDMTKF